LLLYSSYLPLGVFQLAGYFTSSTNAIKLSSIIITAPSTSFFWRRCRGKRRLLQGEFRTHILYFVLSFAFTLFLLASFYQKQKKISFLYSCYFFTLVHYVCRGFVNRSAIEVGVWRFVEGGEHGGAIRDSGSTSLPSFRSRNGGEILHAAIIHYMETSARLQ
jgi:hypothetical protein